MKAEVEILVVPQSESVLKGKTEKYHSLIHLRTKEKDENEGERIPFELACVLDKSKLKWSKRAIRKIIKHMSPKDTLHLIAYVFFSFRLFQRYDTHVDTVFEDGDLNNKEKLVQKVRQINSGSCTNLSGGLERARTLLSCSDKKCVKRIFLFSDGCANVGIQDKKKMFNLVKSIHNDGITITSFGIGNDFDEEMMKGIAVNGKGRYLFLESDTITSQVSKAIHDMLDLLGTDGVIKFIGENNTKVRRLYANEIDSNTDFQIGDIFSKNLKQILVELELDSGDCKVGESYKFMRYEFTYKSKKAKDTITVKDDCFVEVVDDKSKVTDSVVVNNAKKIQEVGDLNHQILDLIKNKKPEEAIKMKEDLIKDLEKISSSDETGHVALMIVNEKESLEMMKKNKNNSEKVKKNIGFCKYRARRLSFKCLVGGEDSDEENWSEDEDMPDDLDDSDTDDDDDDGSAPKKIVKKKQRKRKKSGPLLNFSRIRENLGVNCLVLPETEEFPDSCFVEDCAVITQYCVILTSPGATSRFGEVEEMKSIFDFFLLPNLIEEIEPINLNKEKLTLDGGDVLNVGDHYFIGISDRTNELGADRLKEILEKYEFTASKVNLNNSKIDGLHLKTCVSQLNNQNLLMTEDFYNDFNESFLSVHPFDITVIDNKDEYYSANCLNINGKILFPSGYPETKEKISNLGFEIVEVNVSEFKKVDGGLSCLSLRFEEDYSLEA